MACCSPAKTKQLESKRAEKGVRRGGESLSKLVEMRSKLSNCRAEVRCCNRSLRERAESQIEKPGCVANALSMTRFPRWRARSRKAEVVRAPSA